MAEVVVLRCCIAGAEVPQQSEVIVEVIVLLQRIICKGAEVVQWCRAGVRRNVQVQLWCRVGAEQVQRCS
jgi:hypothetical protein